MFTINSSTKYLHSNYFAVFGAQLMLMILFRNIFKIILNEKLNNENKKLMD